MSRCGGLGVCGCGRDACADAEAWFIWCRMWRTIGFEMSSSNGAQGDLATSSYVIAAMKHRRRHLAFLNNP